MKQLIITGFDDSACQYGQDIKDVSLIVTKNGGTIEFQINEQTFKIPSVELSDLINFIQNT